MVCFVIPLLRISKRHFFCNACDGYGRYGGSDYPDLVDGESPKGAECGVVVVLVG